MRILLNCVAVAGNTIQCIPEGTTTSFVLRVRSIEARSPTNLHAHTHIRTHKHTHGHSHTISPAIVSAILPIQVDGEYFPVNIFSFLPTTCTSIFFMN